MRFEVQGVQGYLAHKKWTLGSKATQVAVEDSVLELCSGVAVKRKFNLPWREAGPPNHHDDKVDSNQ